METRTIFILAKQHENEVVAARELLATLKISLNTGRPESVIRQLLMDEENIRAILLRYRKRLPKVLEKAA